MFKIVHTQSGQNGEIVFTSSDPFTAEAEFKNLIGAGGQGAIALSRGNIILYRHRFDAEKGDMDYCKGVELNLFKD
jgi:hypothetical protein